MEIFAWYYLIFELPLLFAALLAGMQAMGLVNSDQDLDLDTDVDMDVDVDMDLDAVFDADLDTDVAITHGIDGDVDLGHDLDFDSDVDHDLVTVGQDADFEPGVLTKTLGFLGVGKIPISIIMITSSLLWGLSGWIANKLIPGFEVAPHVLVFGSMGIAFATMVLGTGFLSRMLEKVMPTMQTFATTNADLIGSIGEARYQITSEVGSVTVYDQYGNYQEVPARAREKITSGTKVVLMKFDKQNKVFWVRPDALDGERQKALPNEVSKE
jgi:hypothetical protein